jgi:ATP-dependent exoDNAse (exonuclease V) beta subunit
MACDDEVIPLHERIESVADDADLEEVYNTERHPLYVACTRARDHLLVTAVEPASEFLDDLRTRPHPFLQQPPRRTAPGADPLPTPFSWAWQDSNLRPWNYEFPALTT